MPLPLVLAEGTPSEMGASYGRQASEEIRGNFEDYLAKFRDAAGLRPAEVTRAGEEFRAATRRRLPRIADTLDAVAESAGLPVGDIYALNARTELMLPPQVNPACLVPEPSPGVGSPPRSECTGVAVLPEYTAAGHTLLGQNWDWYTSQDPYTLILATRDELGHGIVTLVEAGMLAKAGMNSAGVGVCVNLLGSDRDGAPGGVPYHVLIRHVLDQPDGLAASLQVCALPRSASINLLIAAAGGTALDLELTPGLVGRVLPEGGLLTHANHFVSSIGVYDRFYDHGGSSLFRDFRVRQLLATVTAERRASELDIRESLSDHLGFPYAVCRHVNPGDLPELRSLTASSVVMDLDEGRLAATAGPPCENEYVTVRLSSVFD